VSQKLGDAYKELGKGVAQRVFARARCRARCLEQVYGPRVNAEVAYQLVRESFVRAQRSTTRAVAEPRVEQAAPIKKGQRSRSPRSSRSAATSCRATTRPADRAPPALGRRGAVDEGSPAAPRAHGAPPDRGPRRPPGPGDIVGLSVTGTLGETRSTSRSSRSTSTTTSASRCRHARALTGVRSTPRTSSSRSPSPDDYKDESLRGRKANSRHHPRGPRQGGPGARRRVRQGHRQSRHPRPACARRCARTSRTRARRHRREAARTRCAS